jgi:hypothetical protein
VATENDAPRDSAPDARYEPYSTRTSYPPVARNVQFLSGRLHLSRTSPARFHLFIYELNATNSAV